MEISFSGKRIVVTGAGQGIGRDIVKKLVECKAKVIAVSRTKSYLETLKQECPDIEIIAVDLQNWNATREALSKLKNIDGLVNNAAIAMLRGFFDITEHDVDLSFDVNVKSVINVSQIIAADMVARKSGGAIVNISSQAALAALRDHTVYCGTKGALDSIARCMALELGPHNIRVNCVNPTVIMTEMGKLGWSDPAKAQSMISKIPLGRFGEVDEVVNAVLFLLSDKSSMINGVSLPVDGGFLAT
ncbi:L-xylulose reductase-like [Chrysoperla carnea]|uniref:L-xylulose reductase-like n=1 Tax=Chrysoperla carnea TaxID=189513 RepID=UPI001D06F748|nr:L-xylulose reductase-like [Chrysoperla carnea]